MIPKWSFLFDTDLRIIALVQCRMTVCVRVCVCMQLLATEDWIMDQFSRGGRSSDTVGMIA